MRVSLPRLLGAAGLAVAAAGVAVVTASMSAEAVPFDRTVTGTATYYDDAGYGACGTPIDAATQSLVAVPASYWTTANPNVDPLCSGVWVQVTYHGTTVTVPVKDKCPSCDAGHLDLSKPVFQRFAPTDVGVLTGVTWRFVTSPDGATPPPPTTSTTTTTIPATTRPTTPTSTTTTSTTGAVTAWAAGHAYRVGDRVTYGGATYRCIQAHTALTGWEPPVVPALWGRV